MATGTRTRRGGRKRTVRNDNRLQAIMYHGLTKLRETKGDEFSAGVKAIVDAAADRVGNMKLPQAPTLYNALKALNDAGYIKSTQDADTSRWTYSFKGVSTQPPSDWLDQAPEAPNGSAPTITAAVVQGSVSGVEVLKTELHQAVNMRDEGNKRILSIKEQIDGLMAEIASAAAPVAAAPAPAK